MISHLNDTIYHLILKNGYNNSKKKKKMVTMIPSNI